MPSSRTAHGSPRLDVDGPPDRQIGIAPDLSTYEKLAEALLPLQVAKHESFADAYHCRWDEAETDAWRYRFTDPGGFSATG